MTQAAINAPAPAAPQASDAPVELGGTVEQRADAIFPEVFDDGEDGGDSESTEAAVAAPPAAPDQLAQDRAARRAKALEELNAKTRNAVDSKAAQREAEQLRRQLQAERDRAANLVDVSGLTPTQILELGQRAGHAPKTMAEALAAAAGNPEILAAHAARRAVDPELAALKQSNEALKAQLEGYIQQQNTQSEQQAEDSAHGQLAAFTTQNAPTSPYAASFLKAYGPEEYRKVVEHVMPNVVGGGPQGVLDEVEDFLLARHKALGVWSPAQAAPQRTQANPPRIPGPATQAPTHVTNSLAQQRSSVVDEEAALQDLPYEERASVIFRRH